jgi:flagellar hook-basal body complex protein FliE
METQGIDQVLAQLRAAALSAAGKPADQVTGAGGVDFAQALKSAIADVSQAQQQAQQMAKDFSAGNPSVNLQDVMINLQKASLSFQQMVQVRNRLVSAYQDMMNMQV